MARKILLADDSVTAQNMGRRILSDAGYDVTTVNNGSAALKKIAESKPDLIVLDVYMPGYGGLEVCQRLRESRETARIPVLLTVGKLEPFKPEEARRVKADAFIVKPFEASELLTALTKLEDRIVPQPAPYKPGRFAKAMSAIEADVPSDDYGDLESGWKNRLKIPVPQSHGPEIEVDEQPRQIEPPKPEIPKEQTSPETSALPRDITPEEIAAIHAAAAAFGDLGAAPIAQAAPVASVSEPAPKEQESQRETIAEPDDEVAATFASVAPVEAESEPAEAEHEIESPPTVETAKPEVVEMAPTALAETPVEPPVEEVTPVASSETIPKIEDRDDFAVALESIGPANGHGVPQQLTGPRWIAELVALTDVDSALILEEEMQKAIAAMAVVNEESAQEPLVQAAADSSLQTAPQEPPAAPAAQPGDSQRPEVEPESATSLVAAMAETTALPTLADLVESVLPRVSSEATTPESHGAAFAAAAASSDAISQSSVPAEIPQSPAAPGNEEDRQRESELAAAWESWKHIRESVVEPQFKSPAGEITAETNPPQAEQVSAPQAEPETENGVQEEAGAIASIVDSVLADLKPKLMEEISKKMGKEKKRR